MKLDPQSSDYKRFIAKIAFGADDECWEWTGYRVRKGHGMFRHGNVMYAHRVAYATWVGEIPDGIQVRHICDNPPCCNPHHLLVGTYQDNIDDMVERNRQAKGEKNGSAKITAETAQQIYDEYATPGISIRKVAKDHGISPATVSDIWQGRTWTHHVNRWVHE